MILVWFRRDLRTLDHTALKAALDTGQIMVGGSGRHRLAVMANHTSVSSIQ